MYFREKDSGKGEHHWIVPVTSRISCKLVNTMAGVARIIEKVQVRIINTVSVKDLVHKCLLIGFTIAQYRSAVNTVSVKTDTPRDIRKLVASNLHIEIPSGHESIVYMMIR